MDTPLVSAIITTHNRYELLKKAIESVFNQTYKNIECIVVDDASDVCSDLVLDDYLKDKVINYLYIPKDESKGGNYARNKGIKAAKGKYIAFLDDDDEWLPTKIEKQVEAMEIDGNVGFSYCGMIREYNMDPNTRQSDDITNGKYMDGDIARHVLTRIITTTSAIMVKKDVLDVCGCFDEHLKFWQEYELSIRILQITKAVCIRENLVLYRVIHGDKNRLSNKIEGWERAVEYISIKHKDLIDGLTKEENDFRQFYICVDGIQRARTAGSFKFLVKYAWKILKNRGTRKVFLYKCRAKITRK